MKGVANPAAVLDHGGLGSGARLCDQLSALCGCEQNVCRETSNERKGNQLHIDIVYCLFPI